MLIISLLYWRFNVFYVFLIWLLGRIAFDRNLNWMILVFSCIGLVWYSHFERIDWCVILSLLDLNTIFRTGTVQQNSDSRFFSSRSCYLCFSLFNFDILCWWLVKRVTHVDLNWLVFFDIGGVSFCWKIIICSFVYCFSFVWKLVFLGCMLWTERVFGVCGVCFGQIGRTFLWSGSMPLLILLLDTMKRIDWSIFLDPFTRCFFSWSLLYTSILIAWINLFRFCHYINGSVMYDSFSLYLFIIILLKRRWSVSLMTVSWRPNKLTF